MKNRVEKIVGGLLISLFFVILTTISASAAINPQINFQGKITNPDGTNISNGNYSIRFRLYTDPTLDAANACGANTCSWEETKTVTITDGIFQTALGDTTTLPGSVDFNTNNIYLGIKVGADTEMTPRVRFTASPYAFNSEKVGGFSASQLVQLSPGTQQSGSINVSGSITSASTLAIQGANAVTLGSTTNVGAILFQDGTVNNRTVTLNVPSLATASYSLTLPTSAPAVSQCLQSGATTASQLIFASCGSGATTLQQSYDASGSANPQILLSSTNGGFKIQDATTPIGGNLFSIRNNGGTITYFAASTNGLTVQNANGNALVFDSTSNTLRVFENVASPTNFASVAYAGGIATFRASTGTTRIGGGTGNITGNLTGANDNFSFNKTNTPAGTYSVNDFTVQRTLTGGVNVLAGSVLRVLDMSTGSASSPNVLLINQNNSSATGNLVLAQTGGATTQFSVNTGGDGFFAGNLSIQGASGVSLGSVANAGSLIFKDGTINSRSVSLVAAALPSSYSLTLPTVAPALNECLKSDSASAGQLVFGVCGGAVTLQDSYTASAAPVLVTTTDAKDLQFTLADTATDSNFLVNIATNSTGRFAVQDNSVDVLAVKSGFLSVTNNAAGVIIGNGFMPADSNVTPLVLDSSNVIDETFNTCSASVNNGAMYFNANPGSMSVRSCIGGNWEDMLSTTGAFFAFFGIVPDSGATPGDLQSQSTLGVSGPCKVSWASTTSVNVQACTAFSGGRKVTVASTTITVGTGNGLFQHLCLSGPNNQPALSTPAVETANLSSFSFTSANAPIVCLADIRTTNNSINGIFDTRVYTTSTKEFGYASTALPLGVIVKPAATNSNRVALPGTTATGFLRGVVVATNGAAWTAGGPNVIIATAGPTHVKATAGTLSATVSVLNSTTVNGYAITGTTSTALFGNLGLPQNAFITTCSTPSNCNNSLLVDLRLR